jgi:sulfite reductase (NADPH) hemoprotein beta-component
VNEAAILDALVKIVAHYARSRLDDEHFGDFVIRAGYVPEVTQGRHFND